MHPPFHSLFKNPDRFISIIINIIIIIIIIIIIVVVVVVVFMILLFPDMWYLYLHSANDFRFLNSYLGLEYL